MLLTLDTIYIVTTQKKGWLPKISFAKIGTNNLTAKHLEQLKGGRFPLELLVRGKDQAENEKIFNQICDAINAAGVSFSIFALSRNH